MDYVDDAKVVLRRMEKNQIGIKRASFYSAYALYYEKRKKFDDAEKMYHLGVQKYGFFFLFGWIAISKQWWVSIVSMKLKIEPLVYILTVV